MMPKWAYGFWQSRQRYETQEQLLGVLREYRKRGLPLDNIVQDWFYWPEDQWGCHCFDAEALPRPQGDGRRGPRQRRARDDFGLGQILQGHRQLSRSSTRSAGSTADGHAAAGRAGQRSQLHQGACTATGSAPGYPNAFYDPYNQPARDICSGRSSTASRTRASTPGGSIPTSPTSIRTCRSPSASGAWARPRRGRAPLTSTHTLWFSRASRPSPFKPPSPRPAQTRSRPAPSWTTTSPIIHSSLPPPPPCSCGERIFPPTPSLSPPLPLPPPPSPPPPRLLVCST